MILSQDEILKKVRRFESGDHTDPVAADNYFIFALCDYERFLLHAATTPTEVNIRRLDTVYVDAAKAIVAGASAEKLDEMLFTLRQRILPSLTGDSCFMPSGIC
jgi:hypothetical protein